MDIDFMEIILLVGLICVGMGLGGSIDASVNKKQVKNAIELCKTANSSVIVSYDDKIIYSCVKLNTEGTK